jgi:hypothetical protein
VHPTWRDLVIRQLATDPRARRHFLSRCGVYGAVLALSVAGGVEGERRLPLLRSDEDWDALTDRLYALVCELDLTELIALLSALTQALAALDDAPQSRNEVVAIARTVLMRIKALWDSVRKPIPLAALESWLALGRVLRPRPEPPHLSVTWVELLPADAPRLDDRAAIERFNDWLALCEMLRGYDSGLRLRLNLGPDRADVMAEFIYRVDLLRLEQGPEPFVPDDFEPLLRALRSIGSLQPELSLYADRMATMLRRGRARSPGEGEPQLAEPPIYAGERFDVHRVLMDL